jgi:hypothetical protein
MLKQSQAYQTAPANNAWGHDNQKQDAEADEADKCTPGVPSALPALGCMDTKRLPNQVNTAEGI